MSGVVIIGTPGFDWWTPRTFRLDTPSRGQLVRMAHRAQQAEQRLADTATVLAGIRTWLDTDAGSADRYAETLALIARARCRKYAEGQMCVTQFHRSRDAEYAVDRWCDPCIAADALGVVEVAA